MKNFCFCLLVFTAAYPATCHGATVNECQELRHRGKLREAQACFTALLLDADPFVQAEGYWGIDRSYYNGLGSVPLNINLFSNLAFAIQYRDDLRPGGIWLDLTNGTGSGNLIQIADPNPNPTNRFYRLRIPAN